MTHDEAMTRVLDYAYGEMSPEDAAAFEALIATDKALRAEVEAVRAVREAAARMAPVAIPGDLKAALLREAARHLRRKSVGAPAFWAFLERLFLSPAFTGAMVVVVALGVSVHLLLEMGTEDRLSRTEREEPMEEKALESAETEGDRPAPEATTVAAERGGAVEEGERDQARATWVAQAPPTREKERKRDASGARQAPNRLQTDQVAGGTGQVAREVPPAKHEARPTLEGRLSTDAVGKAVGGRSETTRLGGAGTTRPPAAPPASAASGAEEGVAPQSVAEDRDQPLDDARADLARARRLKSQGALEAALAAYQDALGAGTLTGSDLRDALAEAAGVAIALGRAEEARAYLDRLRTLPGGRARAVPLERRLEPGR